MRLRSNRLSDTSGDDLREILITLRRQMNSVRSKQTIVCAWQPCEYTGGITEKCSGIMSSRLREPDVLLMQRDDVSESLHVTSEEILRLVTGDVVRWRGHEDWCCSTFVREMRDVLEIRLISLRRNSVVLLACVLRHRDARLQHQLHETQVIREPEISMRRM